MPDEKILEINKMQKAHPHKSLKIFTQMGPVQESLKSIYVIMEFLPQVNCTKMCTCVWLKWGHIYKQQNSIVMSKKQDLCSKIE